ncbi:hypothetical protein QTP88_020008 [Uroleucon formosanum]
MKTAYSTIHAKPTTCFHYILGVTFFNFITRSVIFKYCVCIFVFYAIFNKAIHNQMWTRLKSIIINRIMTNLKLATMSVYKIQRYSVENCIIVS